MKGLNPYLHFNGNCEAAMNFYKDCLGDGTVNFMRFSESPMPVPEEAKKLIMHSTFQAKNVQFMASDGMPGQPVPIGGNFAMSLDCENEEEQTTVFNKLAVDGTVVMPLDSSFWGARFGMVTDKFGVSWMLNCELKK